MALPKKIKKYLDSLDDELFLAWLWIRYGTKEAIWEEISQSEYEKYYGKPDDFSFSKKNLEQALDNFINDRNYRAVALYKGPSRGLLDQIQYPPRKPDGYQYEKQVGTKDVLMLGADVFEYCQTRDCMKSFFDKINQVK